MREMADRERDVDEALLGELVHHEFEYRAVAKRQERLWKDGGVRLEPGALASGEDYGFRAVESLPAGERRVEIPVHAPLSSRAHVLITPHGTWTASPGGRRRTDRRPLSRFTETSTPDKTVATVQKRIRRSMLADRFAT